MKVTKRQENQKDRVWEMHKVDNLPIDKIARRESINEHKVKAIIAGVKSRLRVPRENKPLSAIVNDEMSYGTEFKCTWEDLSPQEKALVTK